jgi:multidrug efflux pump subunit AcrA (membrane-fusion protein)
VNGRRTVAVIAAVVIAAVVIAAVVIAAGVITTLIVTSGSGARRAVSRKSATTATVQRTDVAETTPVNGTVGFATPYTIVQPAGTGPQAVTQAEQAVVQAQQALAQAQATLAWDTGQLQADQASLAAAQQQQPNDSTGQKTVDADRQKIIADQDKVAAAQLTLTNARTALATATTAVTAYDATSKYTALAAVGQVIQLGQPLWSVDGKPVPLLPGTLVVWRAFAPGMAPGADVTALNHALTQLGFANGLQISDAFTGATAAAIARLQASLGLPQTGTLPLGSVAFAPTAVRVTTVHPLPGASVAGGQPVLDVTSTTPVVNVALPVSQSSRVMVGDPVSVNLPDGTTGEGTITAIGSVATNTTPSDSGSNSTSATVNVAVSLAKASAAGSLDQAPVTVNITNDSAHQVLAVPTTALLSLAGGGYAVEVVGPDGTHHLVDVTTGIFDDQSGMVEVSGTGLAAGQHVVVAA